MENHWNRADDAAEEDGQPADVEQRHRRQPDIIWVMTEMECRGDCAEPEVAVGNSRALWSSARPGGVDDCRFLFKIDPAWLIAVAIRRRQALQLRDRHDRDRQ